jgi:hypothetical protein
LFNSPLSLLRKKRKNSGPLTGRLNKTRNIYFLTIPPTQLNDHQTNSQKQSTHLLSKPTRSSPQALKGAKDTPVTGTNAFFRPPTPPTPIRPSTSPLVPDFTTNARSMIAQTAFLNVVLLPGKLTVSRSLASVLEYPFLQAQYAHIPRANRHCRSTSGVLQNRDASDRVAQRSGHAYGRPYTTLAPLCRSRRFWASKSEIRPSKSPHTSISEGSQEGETLLLTF